MLADFVCVSAGKLSQERSTQLEPTCLQWQAATSPALSALLLLSHIQPALQVSKQSQKHAAQLEAFQYGVGSRRPAKPHCSKELLNQRRVVDLLARQGCYSKAAAVQEATNGMEAAEMKATLASFEAEVCLPHRACGPTRRDSSLRVCTGDVVTVHDSSGIALFAMCTPPLRKPVTLCRVLLQLQVVLRSSSK